jgi:hypothetical protein
MGCGTVSMKKEVTRSRTTKDRMNDGKDAARNDSENRDKFE